jgi:arginase
MKRRVRIIGIPMDLGQKHRGVDMGPVAIRYAGLSGALQGLGYQTRDFGNIEIPGHYTLTDTRLSQRIVPIRKACSRTYALGREALGNGETPIFLGGDHSASIGSIGGVTHDSACGLIWVDAHGDFNTPDTSDTGNVHGMVLSILLGNGPKELVDVGRKGAKLEARDVVLIGIRDLDPKEKTLLKKSGCAIYTMRDIDEMGTHKVLKEALGKIAHRATIHLSLDMDSIDPQEAPGVGTPSAGGLTYREAQLIMETIADSGRLQSVDVMEVNPILDHCNHTAQVAVSMLASLFGKTIL